ncbi:protein FAR-RED ELONGATED HYPOCOTYL 3-like [Quercus suber]|uniref:protein FAR-RED ELONGATED HYPOCOTYL 3-like n=1 Tax=Quercus suber TaxID=58331 RepID=UPI0032DECF54
MTYHLQKDAMLHVVSFHDQCNHEFAPSAMKHMLRSKRKISSAQKAIANDAERSGISIKQTIELLSMQVGGRENLGFMDVDYKNHVHNERRMALRKGDGLAMMEYFRKMQLANPSYFYSIQVDDDGQIMNIFWADAKSIVDYEHFGDNAAKNLHHVFHSSKHFANDFSDCLYEYEDEDEWLVSWDYMLKEYVLTDNKWLRSIFDIKRKGAMVYGRHMFTADMKRTQCSESINNVLKKYLKPKHDFVRFSGHYSRVLVDKRHQELQAKFKMRQTKLILQSNVEMLRHVVELYTPENFQMFQDEYMKIADCTIYKANKSDTITEYKVKYSQRIQEHLVKYQASTTTVECSCKKFSFVGILCAHALKVLEHKNVKRLPVQYVLKRWTQDAKAGSIKDYHGIDIKGNA